MASDAEVFGEFTREGLVQSLQQFAEGHGRQPTQEDAASAETDLAAPNTYRRYFGTWSEAVEAAGFDCPPRGRPLDGDEPTEPQYTRIRVSRATRQRLGEHNQDDETLGETVARALGALEGMGES